MTHHIEHGMNPATLIPGQRVRIPEKRHKPQGDDAIHAAVLTGNGMPAAIKYAVETETLGVTDEHLDALIETLDSRIEICGRMMLALQEHRARRVGAVA